MAVDPVECEGLFPSFPLSRFHCRAWALALPSTAYGYDHRQLQLHSFNVAAANCSASIFQSGHKPPDLGEWLSPTFKLNKIPRNIYPCYTIMLRMSYPSICSARDNLAILTPPLLGGWLGISLTIHSPGWLPTRENQVFQSSRASCLFPCIDSTNQTLLICL